MIFRRKKNADAVEETNESTDTATAEDRQSKAVGPKAAEGAETGDPGSNGAGTQASGTAGAEVDWAAFDLSRDWREDGPFDLEEVDLEADDVERLDFGSLIITPIPGCELRMQVVEGTDRIVSVLVVAGESAMELSAYSAPRSPGHWAETRAEFIRQTLAAGGTADCVEGPFSTELVRNLPVRTPDGRQAVQPSRMWVAEGPRWLLRGVLLGRAAMSQEVDDDVVGPFYDLFADVIVRRGEHAMPAGDLLHLHLPPQAHIQGPGHPGDPGQPAQG